MKKLLSRRSYDPAAFDSDADRGGVPMSVVSVEVESWARVLSPRELKVALLAAHGLSNKEVARQLGVSMGTVKAHMHCILRKLGAPSRYNLILSLKAKSFKQQRECE